MNDFQAGMMHKVVPAGKHGRAEVLHDAPSSIDRIRGAMHGQPLNCDVYTRLLIGGSVWMTDAEFEHRTNMIAVSKMHGDVLIAGLGIGFIVAPLIERRSVLSITIIEKDADVIKLIAPKFPSVRVIHADIYEWTPPKKSFDCVYLDIWANVPNSDDWADIKALKKKFRPALHKGGWISAWCEHKAKP